MMPSRPSHRLALLAVVTFAIAGSLAGCAKREASATAEARSVSVPTALAVGAPGAPGAAVAPIDRAMRITIDTAVTVHDVAAAAAAVRELTAQHGGYVGEARTVGDDESRSASFEVHVPVARLADFRSGVAGLGEVTSDGEKAEDVTEQRADVRARLSNARAEEQRMLELLANHTGSLADVVAVEKELASVRETIERMEAQERVLEGQIARATVRIQLVTRHAEARLGAARRIGNAFGDGFRNAGSFLVGVTVFAASAGPTLLLIALFGYAVFRGVRFMARRSSRKA